MKAHCHADPPDRGRASIYLAVAILLTLVSSPAAAQEPDTTSDVLRRPSADSTARLTGTVASSQTGGTVSTARVILPELGRGAITDGRGRFTIEGLPPGVHEARVDYFNNSTNQRPVRLEAGNVTRVTFLLDENVLEVAELEVSVKQTPRSDELEGFQHRKERGFGVLFGPKEIAERNPNRSSDLLRRVPGVDIQGRRRRGVVWVGHNPHTQCRPTFWLDGTLVREFFLDDIDPNDLRALEVYRRPSETPPEFTHGGNDCGTIVIWTHRGPS